jgi:hypothetical protein
MAGWKIKRWTVCIVSVNRGPSRLSGKSLDLLAVAILSACLCTLRYVVENSVEERILKIQERKKLVGKGAMSRLSAEEIRKARVNDLLAILEL